MTEPGTVETAPTGLQLDDLPCPAVLLGPELEHLAANPPALMLVRALHDECPSQFASSIGSFILHLAGTELSMFRRMPEPRFVLEKILHGRTAPHGFRIQLSRIGPAGGHDTRILVLLTDTTPQVRLADALRANANHLEEKVAERSSALQRANASLRAHLQELKESASRIRKLSMALEQSAEHILITDVSGIIEYVNPAFEALTGYRNHEVVGRTPRILKSGQHDGAYYENLWRTIASGSPFRGRIINRKKSGEHYFEEKIISPIRGENGGITHYVSVGRIVASESQTPCCPEVPSG